MGLDRRKNRLDELYSLTRLQMGGSRGLDLVHRV